MLQKVEAQQSNTMPQSEDACSNSERFEDWDGILIERKP
jgi:hypothetical protein